MISCINVSSKKVIIVWLQLHPKLIASDYIATGRPLGRKNGVHCPNSGSLSGGSEAWLANPSSLTYFNTNGRVCGLGKTSWYDIFVNHINSELIKITSKKNSPVILLWTKTQLIEKS